jgi:hypothetical protein
MATTYTLISSVTVGSGGASSMTFSSIPSTYTDLSVLISARSTDAGGGDYVVVRPNNATTNFTFRNLASYDSASPVSENGTLEFYTPIPAAGGTASTFGSTNLYIPNYASSNYKSASQEGVNERNSSAGALMLNSNLWSNTAAITSLTLVCLFANFAQYSTAYLYGISNA